MKVGDIWIFTHNDNTNANKIKTVITEINNVDSLQCHPGVVAYLNGTIDDPSKWVNTNNSIPISPIYFVYPPVDNIPSPGIQTAQQSAVQQIR